jgi:hypothetical protein
MFRLDKKSLQKKSLKLENTHQQDTQKELKIITFGIVNEPKLFVKKVPRLSLLPGFPKYQKQHFFAYNAPPKTATFWSKSAMGH